MQNRLPSRVLVAAALAAPLSPAFAQEVTVSGATLFEDFFRVAANSSDFIDADNDGVITDFTANGGDGTVDILYGGIGNGPSSSSSTGRSARATASRSSSTTGA